MGETKWRFAAALNLARPPQAPGRAVQKKSRIALERCPIKRAAFREQIAQIPVEKLVFLDECGFALNLCRLYGWVLGGGRCEEGVPFNKGINRSVLGAFSLPTTDCPTGMRALWQKLGAWTRDTFEAFLQDGLLPHLSQGSVLVLDNARIHHGGNVEACVKQAGCSLLYLPPYSPDFNPIELAWSWIKTQVRTLAPRSDNERERGIQAAAQQLPNSAAKQWFKHCKLLTS